MIRIVCVYPDFLNLYGEYANIKLLCERLEGCGERVLVQSVNMGSYTDFSKADLLYFPAGTEDKMLAALCDFRRYGAEFAAFLKNGGKLLACGNSGAMLCKKITDTRTGVSYEGLSVFDAEAKIVKGRRYGELICESALVKERVIGSLNSSVDFVRADGQQPAFKVLWDSDGRFRSGSGEGLLVGDNIMATELTGPLLYRNPALLEKLAADLCKKQLPDCDASWLSELKLAYAHSLEVLSKEAGRI